MLRLPVIAGTIHRRVLVNYRCDPSALAALLPPPFRPKLVSGFGVAGICLIRLHDIRPRGLPAFVGISSENAAHRIAVEWTDAAGTVREGVYIPRRDSSSLLNHLAGGRVFPGVHHRATFDVAETDTTVRVDLRSNDGDTAVHVDGEVAADLPSGSIFPSVEAASEFFRGGSVGFSPAAGDGSAVDGMELRTKQWHVTPLAVREVRSSFFDDPARFPAGTAVFDNALLMRDVEHEWHANPAP